MVGDAAALLIVYFFVWQLHEQFFDGVSSLVGGRRSRILWRIDLKHQNDLKCTGK